MITTQEIIERSIYQALLLKCKDLGYGVNPDDYQPYTKENETRYLEDISKLTKHVQVFGTGNSESKGEKNCPRIVVEAMGFYPGSIGMPSHSYIREGPEYVAIEVATETVDQYINIRLVSNNQQDLRLIHNIMYLSIPQRGYLKPYYSDVLLSTGNIYMQLVNFFDQPNNSFGILEKVYQFMITDCLQEIPSNLENISPIKKIEILFDNGESNFKIESP